MRYWLKPSESIRIVGNPKCDRITFVRVQSKTAPVQDPDGKQIGEVVTEVSADVSWENPTTHQTHTFGLWNSICHDIPGLKIAHVGTRCNPHGALEAIEVELETNDASIKTDVVGVSRFKPDQQPAAS